MDCMPRQQLHSDTCKICILTLLVTVGQGFTAGAGYMTGYSIQLGIVGRKWHAKKGSQTYRLRLERFLNVL
jgi:hypothetical protein